MKVYSKMIIFSLMILVFFDYLFLLMNWKFIFLGFKSLVLLIFIFVLKWGFFFSFILSLGFSIWKVFFFCLLMFICKVNMWSVSKSYKRKEKKNYGCMYF